MKTSWAEAFVRHVWPLLLLCESDFKGLYNDGKGRPNYSIARKLGVMLLRELKGLESDEEALEELMFNLRWQHALAITHPSEAELSRRSLTEFRSRIARHDMEQQANGVPEQEWLLARVFRKLSEAAIEDLGISVANQRLDSTFIQSNMKQRGRQALMRDSIRGLMKQLDEVGNLSEVPEALQSWYKQDNGWERNHCTVEQTIDWMNQLLELFANDEKVAQSEAYKLLSRIFGDQVEAGGSEDETAPEQPKGMDTDANAAPEPGGRNPEPTLSESASAEAEPVAAADVAEAEADTDTDAQARLHPAPAKDTEPAPSENSSSNVSLDVPPADESSTATSGTAPRFVMRKKSKSDALTSTVDTDARRGRKGTGYLVHITETCGNGEQVEIITDVDVVPANTSDKTQLINVLDRLDEGGRKPETLHVDGGYYTPKNLEYAEDKRVHLSMPVNRSGMPDDGFSRCDFKFDDAGHVTRCPMGHAPVLHKIRTSSAARDPAQHAYFDRAKCDQCPDVERCPVQKPSSKTGHYFLAISDRLRLRDRAWEEQKGEQWKQGYRIRSGIEASNSELKRAHKAGRLKVRRLLRVRAAIQLKTIACNLKRWFKRTKTKLTGAAAAAARSADTASPATRGPQHTLPWCLFRHGTPTNANSLRLAA